MPIMMPEKSIIAALAAGLAAIKADLTIVDDIFDVDVLGAPYIAKVKSYLTANTIHIGQGYGIDDTRLPAWYVVPANITPDEQLVGAFVADDDTVDDESIDADDIQGDYHRYNLRVISASLNGDVTMFLEAIARYILIQAEVWAEEKGFYELTVSTTDFDPLYQHLPQNLFYRSTMLGFRGLSTWNKAYTIIRDAELYIKFDPNEDFIEV